MLRVKSMTSLKRTSLDLIARNARAHDSIAKIYEIKHDEIYNEVEQPRLCSTLDRVLSTLGTRSPKVLDLGAGTGNVTLKLLERGCQVTAVDVSAASLEILKRKATGVGTLSTHVIDSEALPYAAG